VKIVSVNNCGQLIYSILLEKESLDRELYFYGSQLPAELFDFPVAFFYCGADCFIYHRIEIKLSSGEPLGVSSYYLCCFCFGSCDWVYYCSFIPGKSE